MAVSKGSIGERFLELHLETFAEVRVSSLAFYLFYCTVLYTFTTILIKNFVPEERCCTATQNSRTGEEKQLVVIRSFFGIYYLNGERKEPVKGML